MRKIDRPQCPNPTALTRNYKNADNKKALMDVSFGKCMYCEEKITSSQFGDIEHIKPKSKFPSLEFDWDNLGLVCAKCNNAKSDKYWEETPFINPYNEDPENHIVASGTFLMSKQGSERGDLTISQIRLNRPELLEKRYLKIKNIEKAINSCYRTENEVLKNNAIDELKRDADFDKEFSLCVKYLLKAQDLI